jgi:hypothetical protein
MSPVEIIAIMLDVAKKHDSDRESRDRVAFESLMALATKHQNSNHPPRYHQLLTAVMEQLPRPVRTKFNYDTLDKELHWYEDCMLVPIIRVRNAGDSSKGDVRFLTLGKVQLSPLFKLLCCYCGRYASSSCACHQEMWLLQNATP